MLWLTPTCVSSGHLRPLTSPCWASSAILKISQPLTGVSAISQPLLPQAAYFSVSPTKRRAATLTSRLQDIDSTTMSGQRAIPTVRNSDSPSLLKLPLTHHGVSFLSPAGSVPQRDMWVCWPFIRVRTGWRFYLSLKSKAHTPTCIFPECSRTSSVGSGG